MNNEYEIFCDPSYYDMWCVKKIKDRNFNNTKHFITENEAIEYLKNLKKGEIND